MSKPKNIELIRKINKNIVHQDGTIDSFKEQLLDLLGGNFDITKPLIISRDASSLSYINKVNVDVPMVINVSTLIKLQNKHNLTFSDISSIDKLLETSWLAMDSISQETSLVIFTNKLNDFTNNPYIIILRYDKQMQHISVNELTSMYDKERYFSLIYNTYHNNKIFYTNEKTEPFLSLNRLQLPQEIKTILSSNYDMPSFNKSQYQAFQNYQNKVSTPRGLFEVTNKSVKELQEAHYGVWHSSDDGKYLILSNGIIHVAIEAQRYYREKDILDILGSMDDFEEEEEIEI